MLATALSPEDSVHGTLLTAYEYNEGTGYEGEVAPNFYEQFRHLPFPTKDTLGLLPANHFVWSDDLIEAYSNFVDLTWNREGAQAACAGVRWTPALIDCASIVAESVDFSPLSGNRVVKTSSQNRIYCSNKIWTLEFNGSAVQIKNSKGIGYINHLLTHPLIRISATELYRLITPPPIQATSFSSVNEALDSISQESDSSSGFEGSHGGAFDPIIDAAARQNVLAKCKALGEQLEDSRERGNHEKAAEVEEQLETLLSYLKGSMNINGRSRSFNRDSEKVRKAVRKAIKDSMGALLGVNLALGNYLNENIETGHDCQFTGDAWLGRP